jgi:hypothetical protein
MNRQYIFFLLLMFLVIGYSADAQMKRKNIKKNNKQMSRFKGIKSGFEKEKLYYIGGVSLNAMNYYGDLSPAPSRISTDISFTRPALGFTLGHRFGPRYTVTAGLSYGALKGSDADSADPNDLQNAVFRYRRNLSFRNRISELSTVATIDLFKNEATYISRVKWTPYVFAGVALFHHNPQGQVPATGVDGQPLPDAGKWVNLRPLGTEGQYSQLEETDINFGIKPYKNIQPAIPFGLGVRWRVNEVVDFSVEFGFRYLFTDYLDDVSQHYVDLGVFGDNNLAKTMSYRSTEVATPSHTYTGRDGNTYSVVAGYGSENPENMRGNKNNNDFYTVTTFKLTYILGKTFHRAKFR